MFDVDMLLDEVESKVCLPKMNRVMIAGQVEKRIVDAAHALDPTFHRLKDPDACAVHLVIEVRLDGFSMLGVPLVSHFVLCTAGNTTKANRIAKRGRNAEVPANLLCSVAVEQLESV